MCRGLTLVPLSDLDLIPFKEGMMRDKRSGSFGRDREKPEKATPISRTLSWLSVSSLSQQTRKLFRSQNSLHRHSNTPHGVDEDDDDWVYEPQHCIGEDTQCVCEHV